MLLLPKFILLLPCMRGENPQVQTVSCILGETKKPPLICFSEVWEAWGTALPQLLSSMEPQAIQKIEMLRCIFWITITAASTWKSCPACAGISNWKMTCLGNGSLPSLSALPSSPKGKFGNKPIKQGEGEVRHWANSAHQLLFWLCLWKQTVFGFMKLAVLYLFWCCHSLTL